MTYFNEFGQARLGWNVGTPSGGGGGIDSDAQAFITAASITDSTQQSAINTLVTQLKTYGIWTKIKALYPFVGGTASSHKWNLKDPRDLDAAYRLVFNGGWTHSATGALPNGTTAYADTKLIPSTSLSLNSTHVSYYSRTDIARYGIDFGAFQSGPSGATLYGTLKDTDGKTYFRVNRNSVQAESSLDITSSSVFYMINRIPTYGGESLFINNTKTSFNVPSTALPTVAMPLGALSNNGTYTAYSNRQTAFASIGDGLTDAEATAFYNAVQTYQTTLGRQV